MNMEYQTAGGAATASGMNFQHRVAAWVAVHILAEKDASPPWDLPSDVTLEWIRCETEQSVDDLLVGTSDNGYIYAQVKRRVQRSKSAESELASALDQFVRQFIACRSASSGQVCNRPLDPEKDRLVLIISPSSSRSIKDHLPIVLNRIRYLTQQQSLDEAARNRSEREVLDVTKEHLCRSWRQCSGGDPSEDELRQILSLMRVQVLDVDGGGDNEREALNLLRQAVLQDPEQDQVAWHRLINLCATLASQRSRADRKLLQRGLLNSGICLKAAQSYRSDIDRLRRYSANTLSALARHAEIRIGSNTIKIERPCVRALRDAVEEDSIVVVGEPGAGKSGALYDFVKILEEQRRDYVFMAADRLPARSPGELQAEIGMDHELPEVLDNWPGLEPAFLVIDALDAARDASTAKTLQDLIRQVIEKKGRWRVIVAIRKFDLRYSKELKSPFRGSPPTDFQDPEFEHLRHLNIPCLSDDELDQIAEQVPEIEQLFRVTSHKLHEMLRVPFNLQLMAELLSEGVRPEELTPIRTQIELLDRYWTHQIIRDDSQGDAREALLREMCEKMVANRSLRVDRSEIARAETSTILTDLLSTQVLVEWQPSPEAKPERYILSFAHHVLFDYAVARLLLRGDPRKVVQRLTDDRDLVIVIRPSLVLHFHHLWNADPEHRQFWNLVFQIIQTPEIPEIGKLIGPSVAAELAKAPSDLEFLCSALESSDSRCRETAEHAFRHLIGSLLASIPNQVKPDQVKVVGPNAGPWCKLLERISRNLRVPTAYSVRLLLSVICEHPENLTPEQLTAAGHAARRLLEFAWSHEPRDDRLVIDALQCVCRTFESDCAASAELIRRCIEPSHLAQFGYQEMPWLAQEVERLIPLDPRLVGEIYRAAFAHEESSQELTPVGQSLILPLFSNRQQDYRMALYELTKVFPQFLEHAPEEATGVLIDVMEIYVAKRHPPAPSERDQEETFDFNGHNAWILTDYSAIWDEGDTYRDNEPVKMLDAFQQYLESLAGHPEEIEKLRRLVRIIVLKNRLAVLWRRLLIAGTRFPETLGKEILPLVYAVPILTGFDTSYNAGEFLKVIFPILKPEERQRIERTILSIPNAVPENRRATAKQTLNLLLGCLPEKYIVAEETRHLLVKLKKEGNIPLNEPPMRFKGIKVGAYGEEEYLRDQGVPVEAEVNRRIQELEHPVKEFADRHLNSVPDFSECMNILPALRALFNALERADADDVHPKQHDYAWETLTKACAQIARLETLSCDDESGTFVKDVLIRASHHPEPTPDPQRDSQFDKFPPWEGPAARIEAAKGLILLARHKLCADSEVLDAIQRLSGDPVPAVRFQIASRLDALFRTAPELMWCIAERMSQQEQSRGVLQGFLVSLSKLAGAEPDRVAGLAKRIYDRIKEDPGAKKVREYCVGLLTNLYIWRNHPLCGDIIMKIVCNLSDYLDEASHVIARLNKPLTHGPISPSDPQADAVRQRTIDLVRKLLKSIWRTWCNLKQRNQNLPFDEWPQKDQNEARTLWQLIDNIALEVYFASGADDAKYQRDQKQRVLPSLEARRFYREVTQILDELAQIGHPRIAHTLLETLEFFVPIDPRGVFLRVGTVVRTAQQWGYQYESLAADLIVRLIERYLADYRALLQEDKECRKVLIEILDVFVKAGWPSARRLAYRLEEIFR